jgi:hypothetical protein
LCTDSRWLLLVLLQSFNATSACIAAWMQAQVQAVAVLLCPVSNIPCKQSSSATQQSGVFGEKLWLHAVAAEQCPRSAQPVLVQCYATYEPTATGGTAHVLSRDVLCFWAPGGSTMCPAQRLGSWLLSSQTYFAHCFVLFLRGGCAVVLCRHSHLLSVWLQVL